MAAVVVAALLVGPGPVLSAPRLAAHLTIQLSRASAGRVVPGAEPVGVRPVAANAAPAPFRSKLGSLPGAVGRHALSSSRGVNGAATEANSRLDLAADTLAAGAGPATGDPLTCVPVGASASTCASLRPPAPAPSPAEGWQNASTTDGAAGSPPPGFGGAMAYDGLDGYVVYFGGDNGADFLNQTWLFVGDRWRNDTGVLSSAPPAEAWPTMTYDPLYDAVLLYGGCSRSACPNNYTWYYTGASGWTNLTQVLSPATPALLGASLAFASDEYDAHSILFGGCLDSSCTSLSNQTYAFAGSGWIQVPTTQAPPPAWDERLAYNPDLGELVLFGGCTSSNCADGQTWTFYNFDWANATSSLALAGPTPPGRSAEVLTWDELDGELVMFGGTGRTGLLNDTWGLVCASAGCAWRNLTAGAGPVAAMSNVLAPSQSNATEGTMMYGGERGTGGPVGYSNATYIFEPALAVAPALGGSAPARTPVTARADPSGGSGSYARYTGSYSATWTYDGTETTGLNTTLNFSTPGDHAVELTAIDRFGASTTARLTYLATGPSSSITGETSGYIGEALTLMASPATGGNPPYDYRWTFGDGESADGQSVSHAWAAPGAYSVTLYVVDATGVISTTNETVRMVAPPSVNVTASRTLADEDQPVTFYPIASGIGTPLSYSWEFADGSAASTLASPTHSFDRPGSYNVTVVVMNSSGARVEAWLVVTVDLAVGGAASVSSPNGTVGDVERFDAVPTGGTLPYTVAWVYGDGGTGSGTSANHTYRSAGSFSARVWLNDSVGGSFNTTVSVQIVAGSISPGPGYPETSWTLLASIIVLVVAAAAALVLLRRRGRRSFSRSTEEDSGRA